MNLSSQNGYLLIRPITPEEKVTKSGIVLVDNTTATDEQIANGIVVVGTDKYKAGTTIYFNKLIPSDILLKENGEEKQFFALQEQDVMFSEL